MVRGALWPDWVHGNHARSPPAQMACEVRSQDHSGHPASALVGKRSGYKSTRTRHNVCLRVIKVIVAHTALHLSGTHNIRCSTSVQRRTVASPLARPRVSATRTHSHLHGRASKRRPPMQGTHTHTIYAVRRVYSATAVASPLAGCSPVGHRRVTEITPPPPRPPIVRRFSAPPAQKLLQHGVRVIQKLAHVR